MLDERVAILQVINPNPCGVTELVKRLRWKPKRVISLLRAMEREGLIDFLETAHSRKVGRPPKVATVTMLGNELLNAFLECKKKIIQINENDIKSAIYQASLCERLIEHNISPYQRFFELSNLALRIRSSVIHKGST